MKIDKNQPVNTDRFTDFMRKLIQVPHSEIKDKLDAEKEAKKMIKASDSRGAAVSSKVR